MKKIFIMAYARKNLGDDLFIKMLLDRYPMHDFFMKINNYDFLEELDKLYNNLHVIDGFDTDDELYNTNINEYDGYIYIGGSIFIEGGKVYNLSEHFYEFTKRCKLNNKFLCYVSCNYGPFQTENYFNLSKMNFAECSDICFRDQYSYNLFKDIKTVRYAPDFAFTYPIKNVKKIKDSIGISVIDLRIREAIKEKKQEYLKMLVNNIKIFLNNGKKVYLYSFCKYEGDESVIDFLLECFQDENLIDVRYDGKINEFINIYSKMEYNICSKFHAVVLSCISSQKIYVMSYSKKIDNTLQDLNINAPIVHFSEIDENLIIDLNDFIEIDDMQRKLIINSASKQEDGIKEYLLSKSSK